MNCEGIKNLMTSYLAGELSQSESVTVETHVSQCRGCGNELATLRRVWNLMGEWEDREAAAYLESTVLGRIRAEPQSQPVPSWLGDGITQILFSALIASLLSIVGSVLLGYGKAVRLSKLGLQELGILAYLPDSTIFFIVGCLYGLLPLLVVGLTLARIADGGGLRLGLWVVALFLLITLPYVVIECRTFAVAFTLSLIGGLAVGAFSGSAAGLYLGNRWLTLVGQH